ncbi:MAG: hypothetical protein ACRD1T_16525 [Acidimicrobiia bacterium]
MLANNLLRSSSAAVASVLLVSVTFAPMGTAASGRKQRTVEVPYQSPAVAFSSPTVFATLHCHPTFSIGCVRIPTHRTDRLAKIAIDDLGGQQVMAMVLDKWDNELAFFCGGTKGEIPVPSMAYIEVWLVAGTCAGTTVPSIVTTGHVRVTFFSR